MPRGKRKTALESIAEQLAAIDKQIQAEQEKIKGLESQKKQLLEQKKKQEIEALYSKIQASGKTVDEIFEAIQDK